MLDPSVGVSGPLPPGLSVRPSPGQGCQVPLPPVCLLDSAPGPGHQVPCSLVCLLDPLQVRGVRSPLPPGLYVGLCSRLGALGCPSPHPPGLYVGRVLLIFVHIFSIRTISSSSQKVKSGRVCRGGQQLQPRYSSLKTHSYHSNTHSYSKVNPGRVWGPNHHQPRYSTIVTIVTHRLP